jgi:hypothetical protein
MGYSLSRRTYISSCKMILEPSLSSFGYLVMATFKGSQELPHFPVNTILAMRAFGVEEYIFFS